MHHNITSSNSHILQDELDRSTVKRSNSLKRPVNQELLTPDVGKVEKIHLSKDDHEVVESSQSINSHDKKM